MSVEEFDEVCEKLNNVHYPCGKIYREMNLKRALVKRDDELESIYHLTEAHSPGFRYRATALYEKAFADSSCKMFPLTKDHFTFGCSTEDQRARVQRMLDRVEEMPKEWTLVQLTPSYNMRECLEIDPKQSHTNALHVAVFDCGQCDVRPFAVTVPPPKNYAGDDINVMHEINRIIVDMKERDAVIRTKPNNQREYSAFRNGLNDALQNAVKVVQDKWLREWRILFLGKFVELEDEVRRKVDELLEAHQISNVSQKSREILVRLCKGHEYLNEKAKNRVLQYCLPNLDVRQRLKLLRALPENIGDASIKHAKKHPVILIVDEFIDQVPWEMIDVMSDQPSSRMQSIHFTYALYKEYENDIVDGWKVISDGSSGTYVLNPSRDLHKMEHRLSSFYSYWTPGWRGLRGQIPNNDEFVRLISDGQIFSYNGHGDGFQFLSGRKLSKLRVQAVVLLFGCSSVQLNSQGPQCEKYGSHQHYITACSPCVVGMLWSVTDTATDLFSTEFMSRWIPSKAKVHWLDIDKKTWQSGSEAVDMLKLPRNPSKSSHYSHELQTALLLTKQSSNMFMVQAACVARGLPVRIRS